MVTKSLRTLCFVLGVDPLSRHPYLSFLIFKFTLSSTYGFYCKDFPWVRFHYSFMIIFPVENGVNQCVICCIRLLDSVESDGFKAK